MKAVQKALTIATLVAVLLPRGAGAYTPDSPKVKEMVRRGVRYIETHFDTDPLHPQKLGKICLAGLVILKHSGDTEHSLIQRAIEKCRVAAGRGPLLNSASGVLEYDNYSMGIALLFLCELDAQEYRTEIDILLDAMLRRQKSHGGWGYSNYKTGDTSQTQYNVLGLWITTRRGVNVPQDAAERVCAWLIRTQAPEGNWGYQGVDSGTLGQRRNQSRRTLSLSAAGLGSAYICADLLAFTKGPSERTTRSRLPAALREVGVSRPRRAGPITDAIPTGVMQSTLRDGDRWFSDNYKIEASDNQHYYMYALERYMSFREIAERSRTSEPYWYNDGVDFLAATQGSDGEWSGKSSQSGRVIDTAFSTLFLLRSTKGSIGRVFEETGRLRGGKLLPSDLSEIVIDKRGQVVSTKESPPVDNLLSMLEDLEASEMDTSIPKKLSLSTDTAQRAAQLARLRRLAASGSYQARLTAVQTLGNDRDLRNIPALIFALEDPDRRVSRAASDGLRFISRKIDGFGLSASPSEAEQERAVAKWKAWYESVQGAQVER